jgi:hypothetical protein
VKVLNHEDVTRAMARRRRSPRHENVFDIKKQNTTKTKPKVSVILLDWECRERFHTLDWLLKQSVAREQYELIWVELYRRQIPAVMEKADSVVVCNQKGMYHKHKGYNAGLLVAQGNIITVCDSDAVYPENFIESILSSFQSFDSENLKSQVLMHHQWRTSKLYPDDLNDCMTLEEDHWEWWPLNHNAGACMSVTKKDAIRFGGFDEHTSFAGYLCGPYDLGWRLVNAGFEEKWHDPSIASWHFAHPDPVGTNMQKPSVKMLLENTRPHVDLHALTAVDAFSSGRMLPLTENEEIFSLRMANRKIGSEFEKKYSEMTGPEGFPKGLVLGMALKFKLELLGEIARKVICKRLQALLPPTIQVRLRILQNFFNPVPIEKPEIPQLFLEYRGYNLVFHKNQIFAIPANLGEWDLTQKDQSEDSRVIRVPSPWKAIRQIDVTLTE